MRPKKRILMVHNGDPRSFITFVFLTHGYSGTSVNLSGNTVVTHNLGEYDLLLICGDLNVKWTKGRPKTPTIWYAQTKLRDVPHGVRVAESEGVSALLETIRTQLVKKRGRKVAA